MTAVAKELAQIIDSLPEAKAQEVVDFARFLQHQASDATWERILDDSHPRPKLDKFAADALREGPAEPLDLSKL